MDEFSFNKHQEKYQELQVLFESLKSKRIYEILDALKKKDEKYCHLLESRAEQSVILQEKIGDNSLAFEKYMDMIYEQELYELDEVYAQAFYDALWALQKLGLM